MDSGDTVYNARLIDESPALATAGTFRDEIVPVSTTRLLKGQSAYIGLPLQQPGSNTKKPIHCHHENCNKTFGRIHELHRHNRSVHEKRSTFHCRHAACERAHRGFPRKDKRDDHERKMHSERGNRKNAGDDHEMPGKYCVRCGREQWLTVTKGITHN
jgi:hypothetical protein